MANALMSEMIHDHLAHPMTTTLADYLCSASPDSPDIRVELIDTRPATNALGLRGIGESGTIAPPAAILNAVARAVGGTDTPRAVPVTPERVLAALGVVEIEI